MSRSEMRAGDADRQRVAERLRAALEEGRLDLQEYDERVQRAYAAKTYGDLDGLLTDLPVVVSQAVQPPVASGTATREWLGQIWGSWFAVLAVTTAVWVITCIASGAPQYYWPVWVAGPWGFFLVITTLGGLATGTPQKAAAEKQFRVLAREHQQKRRALQREAIARGELAMDATKEQRRQFIDDAIARGDLPPRPEKA
ncbi:DUF1707 domain-containing protein [Actinoplanes sp. TBRC 11911]|uniref:DUF1707 SHOCT-like domain-containing protein n=1 Tax=Actinoplanes sp. TBRC 11911 TaxID=2729386 RepID=UPI00200708DF|nr:DUF1707 domain-containing protein [Actinoplanes sp. TBRC 11911]